MLLRLSNRRLPAVRYPLGLELAYVRLLQAMVRGLRDDALTLCAERLPRLLNAATRQDDANADLAATSQGGAAPLTGWALEAESLMNLMVLHAKRRMHIAASAIPNFGRAINAHGLREWRRLVRAAYGLDALKGEPELRPLLAAWERQNLDLVTRMNADAIGRLRGVLVQSVVEGRSLRETAALVRGGFDPSERRAENVARDQVGTLTGRLSQFRQETAGIQEFIWRTVGGNQSRPEHRARNGNKYRWDAPPNGERPGQPIRCRCSAQPVFPTTLALTPGAGG